MCGKIRLGNSECGSHEKPAVPLSAVAMERFQKPVVVEIQAHAGIDIGDTFIGMHLRPVAVPVRLSVKCIGQAHLTLARPGPGSSAEKEPAIANYK